MLFEIAASAEQAPDALHIREIVDKSVADRIRDLSCRVGVEKSAARLGEKTIVDRPLGRAAGEGIAIDIDLRLALDLLHAVDHRLGNRRERPAPGKSRTLEDTDLLQLVGKMGDILVVVGLAEASAIF